MDDRELELHLGDLDEALPGQEFCAGVMQALPAPVDGRVQAVVLLVAVCLGLGVVGWLFPLAQFATALLSLASQPVLVPLLGLLPCLAGYGLARSLLAP